MNFSALNVDFSSLTPNLRVAQTGIKEGYPSKNSYLSVVGLSSVKILHIGMDMLLIKQALATSFLGMSTSMTLDDLEP